MSQDKKPTQSLDNLDPNFLHLDGYRVESDGQAGGRVRLVVRQYAGGVRTAWPGITLTTAEAGDPKLDVAMLLGRTFCLVLNAGYPAGQLKGLVEVFDLPPLKPAGCVLAAVLPPAGPMTVIWRRDTGDFLRAVEGEFTDELSPLELAEALQE